MYFLTVSLSVCVSALLDCVQPIYSCKKSAPDQGSLKKKYTNYSIEHSLFGLVCNFLVFVIEYNWIVMYWSADEVTFWGFFVHYSWDKCVAANIAIYAGSELRACLRNYLYM